MSESDEMLHIRACRICLDSNSFVVSEAVSLNYQTGWLQLFESCFGISLSTQDRPHSLCQKCATNVKKYSEFKELCHKSDNLWKSISNESSLDVQITLWKQASHSQCSSVETSGSPKKCFVEKNEPSKLVKDEVVDHEENDIACNKESNNYVYAEEFGSDFNNFTDNTDEIKNENDKSEIFMNEVSIFIADTSLVTKNVSQKCDSKTKIKRPDSDQNEVKDLFTCRRCQKNYGSKLWYLKHLKSCTLNKSTTYLNKEQKPGTKVNLQDNYVILKSCKNMEKHVCGVCKFSSNRIDDVTKHLEEHWINNDLKCMMCEFLAKDQAAIAAHRYNHVAKTSRFLCHICQKRTKSQLTLQFHYRKVHLNKIGGLCSQLLCNKVYDSLRLWKRHEKLHSHPGYVCDICGQKYKQKHQIAEHIFNHVNPPSHVCDVCGRTFVRLRNLRVHIGNVHVKSEPVKCSHCNRMFKNQNYLRSHQKYLAMEKIWKCEFCPMEYPMLSSLNSHLKSHSEERPYACNICRSRYKAKSQLVIHMRNHTGDRPFNCTLCSKAFKSNPLLRRHNRVHTGILPYKCLHCKMTFRCKKSMMKHCTIRHKTIEKSD